MQSESCAQVRGTKHRNVIKQIQIDLCIQSHFDLILIYTKAGMQLTSAYISATQILSRT